MKPLEERLGRIPEVAMRYICDFNDMAGTIKAIAEIEEVENKLASVSSLEFVDELKDTLKRICECRVTPYAKTYISLCKEAMERLLQGEEQGYVLDFFETMLRREKEAMGEYKNIDGIGENVTGDGEKMSEFATEQLKTGVYLRRVILQAAEECVCCDRNSMYGEPEDNFKMIAKLWSAYLETEINEKDVADMMILFKVGRSATAERPSRDTYVDIAGYAACAGGMME